jgi:hypothetical protein
MHSTVLDPSMNPHMPAASPNVQLVPAFFTAAAPTTGATQVAPVGEDTQPSGNPESVQFDDASCTTALSVFDA